VCTEPEVPCKLTCIDIPEGELVTDDNFQCNVTPGSPKPCKSACNGTCSDKDNPGATEIGAFFISTEFTETEEIAR